MPAKQKAEFELVLERVFDAPPEKVFRAWTDPELLKQWFVPKPWKLASVDQDIRAGGKANIVMADPDGNEYPNMGVFLEVVPNRKIVTTDAFTEGWVPSGKPFMAAETTFEPAPGGKTKYTARAMHWNAESKAEHEKMGFHEGWGAAADQLAELLKKI
ncbi:MAG: SRPBCC family protein [Rhizobiaceae bacterium]|nr:SRPBCC family protein [Rhizobiaceae bacterium]